MGYPILSADQCVQCIKSLTDIDISKSLPIVRLATWKKRNFLTRWCCRRHETSFNTKSRGKNEFLTRGPRKLNMFYMLDWVSSVEQHDNRDRFLMCPHCIQHADFRMFSDMDIYMAGYWWIILNLAPGIFLDILKADNGVCVKTSYNWNIMFEGHCG